jgi:hypothetical protein
VILWSGKTDGRYQLPWGSLGGFEVLLRGADRLPWRRPAVRRSLGLAARDYAARSRCSTLSTAAGVHCLPRRVTKP